MSLLPSRARTWLEARANAGSTQQPLDGHCRDRSPPARRIGQDHRAVKRRVRSMLGFKSADSARVILGGIELVHMLRKQQAKYACSRQPSLAEQFHLLAA